MGRYKNHRKIIEKKIGRKLKPGEIIHHKDHNPLNNSVSNLEIVTLEEHNIETFKGKNALYKWRKKKIPLTGK